VASLAGGNPAAAVIVRRLQVGPATLRDQPAALVTVDGAGPERGDGLLPLHLFSRVYFNNRDRYVSIE
jgi:hypothetical protein